MANKNVNVIFSAIDNISKVTKEISGNLEKMKPEFEDMQKY
jgi:hypothetical protein